MLSRIKTGLAFAGAVIVALAIAFFRGRQSGKEYLAAEQSRAREALQEKYDEIDNQPVDASPFDRLRQLSDDQDRR